jgi:hypothetical protein
MKEPTVRKRTTKIPSRQSFKNLLVTTLRSRSIHLSFLLMADVVILLLMASWFHYLGYQSTPFAISTSLPMILWFVVPIILASVVLYMHWNLQISWIKRLLYYFGIGSITSLLLLVIAFSYFVGGDGEAGFGILLGVVSLAVSLIICFINMGLMFLLNTVFLDRKK